MIVPGVIVSFSVILFKVRDHREAEIYTNIAGHWEPRSLRGSHGRYHESCDRPRNTHGNPGDTHTREKWYNLKPGTNIQQLQNWTMGHEQHSATAVKDWTVGRNSAAP